MNLHEYQAKFLLKSEGLNVVKGFLCYTQKEVERAFDNLTEKSLNKVAVVKAQVHAGGRGKAGGVKLVKSSLEAKEVASKILGMRLVTPQTGEQGKLVNKVYVESGTDIKKEYYLSLLVDRASKCIIVIASTEGGMDIEEVAHSTPNKIFKLKIDPSVGLQSFQSNILANELDLELSLHKPFEDVLSKLYRSFIKYDFGLLEVNPLVLNSNNDFVILDAKVNVDDNAIYRHSIMKEFNDYDESNDKDIAAGRFGLSYIALDGNIGCMVNGAGLAMATMDIIKMYGGDPANFLDVGGGASQETVTEAFKILLSDNSIKAILVNIFGGIMKCDVIASGIVSAAKQLALNVPLVVRLQGTNVDLGREILNSSGLKIVAATTMDEAAEKVVQLAKGI